MATEIEALKSRLESMDQKTDRNAVVVSELRNLVLALRDELKNIVNNTTELATMKSDVNAAVASLDRDLAQLDATNEEPATGSQ